MIRIFLFIFALSIGVGLSSPPDSHANTQQAQAPLILADQDQATTANSSTEELLEDITGPIELARPLPWKIIAAWTLFALVVIALLFFIWKNLHKQKLSTITAGQKGLLALDKLIEIKSEKTGIVYMEKISELLRIYIEERFQLQSMRQTTKEFLLSVSRPTTIAEIDTQLAHHKDSLQDCLELSDMAKFAHCPPGQQSLDDIERAVRSFIQITDIQESKEDTV